MLGNSSSDNVALSPEKGLRLATSHLENARRTTDPELALMICNEARIALSRIERSTLEALLRTDSNQDQTVCGEAAYVVSELDKMLTTLGSQERTQASHKSVETVDIVDPLSTDPLSTDPLPVESVSESASVEGASSDGAPSGGTPESFAAVNSSLQSSKGHKSNSDIATISSHIFAEDMSRPSMSFKLSEPHERLKDTSQLNYCLRILQAWRSSPDCILDSAALDWLHAIERDRDEEERLKTLTTDVIRAFTNDGLKNTKAVTEVISLSPVLEKDDFRAVFNLLCNGIEQSALLNPRQLEWLSQLIRDATPGYLEATDFVKVLEQLKDRLRDVHKQSPRHIYQLSPMVSNVLDAMADTRVKGSDREQLQELLSDYLDGLKSSSDSYLVYQAAYTYQALLYISDNEPLWRAPLQFTRNVIQGKPLVMTAIQTSDLDGFFESLQMMAEPLKYSRLVSSSSSFKGVKSLIVDGQNLLDHLDQGLNFEHKRSWYPALRMADTLLRYGQFVDFRRVICEAPCRRDPAFQWGLCQLLGDLAADSEWNTEIHQSAIALLGEIYQEDTVWGQQASVKQRIIDVLMQIATLPESVKRGTVKKKNDSFLPMNV
ncbi:hypothetical protein BGZ65_007459 [Modicella reniformis]|uniref:Arm-like repeat domain-containing protein n=1 Tax=Modicella reniformis TaxID=1440133 RepID=A0A9P6MFG0_9FUNG|nr:hypothetical protein BGZ65_007459 [Modicella reniformis]